MNFLQKSILRFKPDIIFNRNIFPKIYPNILEYAIKCGLNLNEIPEDRKQEFFSNTAYINEISKYSDDEFLKLIIENADIVKYLTYSEPKLLERIDKINFGIIDDEQLKIIADIDGECVIKIIKEKPDFIKNINKDYHFDFTDEDIESLRNAIKESNLKMEDLPYSILNRFGVVRTLCERNINEVLNYFSNKKDAFTQENVILKDHFEKSFAIEEVKKYILSNPQKNAKYLGDVYQLFPFHLYFTEREKEILSKAIKDSNTIISDDFPEFVKTFENLANSIFNATEPSQINNLRRSLSLNTYNSEVFINKIGQENLIKKLKEIGYIYDKQLTPMALTSNPELIIALIENNPYTIEELAKQDLDIIQYTDGNTYTRIMEILEKNDYVFSSKTPDFLFYGLPDFLLDAYEMDFENFYIIPELYGGTEEENIKFLKREYEIIKEHDPNLELLNVKNKLKYYGWDEDRVFYLNPYLFEEGLKRGLIKLPSEDLIRDKLILSIPKIELIAPFLKKYYEENDFIYVERMSDLFSSITKEIEDNAEKSDLTEIFDNKKVDYSEDFVFNIDNYNFNGIAQDKDFIKEISEKLFEEVYGI